MLDGVFTGEASPGTVLGVFLTFGGFLNCEGSIDGNCCPAMAARF